MGKIKILAIDDDIAIRESLEIILTAEGHEVVTACDGTDALRKLALYEPQLILLDIMMVPLDGLAFLQELRRQGKAGLYPIIVMTAMLGISEELTLLQEKGEIESWIRKPLDNMGRVYILLEDIEKLTQARISKVEDDVSGYNQTQALYPVEAIDDATS